MPKKKPPSSVPFMVFHEAFDLPDGRNRVDLLNDPNAPAADRDAVRADFHTSVEVARDIAQRNTQQARHEKNHAKRDRVLADMKRDARGGPARGEPKRLADLHGVSLTRVRKWIEQDRAGKPTTPTSPRLQWETTDWQTIYHGEALRAQQRRAGRARKKNSR